MTMNWILNLCHMGQRCVATTSKNGIVTLRSDKRSIGYASRKTGTKHENKKQYYPKMNFKVYEELYYIKRRASTKGCALVLGSMLYEFYLPADNKKWSYFKRKILYFNLRSYCMTVKEEKKDLSSWTTFSPHKTHHFLSLFIKNRLSHLSWRVSILSTCPQAAPGFKKKKKINNGSYRTVAHSSYLS